MKKILLFTSIFLCLLFCSCSSDSSNESNNEEAIENFNLDSIKLNETTIYKLKECYGEPDEKTESKSGIGYWIYKEQYYADIPCNIEFKLSDSPNSNNSTVQRIEINFTDNLDKLISSLTTEFTQKYSSYEEQTLTSNLEERTVYKWSAYENAGETRFNFIYLEKIIGNNESYKGYQLTFTQGLKYPE